MFECGRCFSFVPDYFEHWRNIKPLRAQVSFHEAYWAADSKQELNQLEADLTRMVGEFRGELGEPGPGNLVLEIGAGRGALLKGLRNCGYEVLGCEPSQQLVALARRHYGLSEDVLRQTDARDFIDFVAGRGLRPRSVFLWHVIEHMTEPLETLGALAALLGPGGRLLAQVPLLASQSLYPEHYFFATHLTARHLADSLGLMILREDLDPQRLFRTIVFEVGTGKASHLPRSVRMEYRLVNRTEPVVVRDQALAQSQAAAQAARDGLEQLRRELAVKNEIIAGQARMVEERWDAMQQMGRHISERDELIQQQRLVADEGREVVRRLEQEIAGQQAAALLAARELATVQATARNLQQNRDELERRLQFLEQVDRKKTEIISRQAELIEQRWNAILELRRDLAALLARPAVRLLLKAGLIRAPTAKIAD